MKYLINTIIISGNFKNCTTMNTLNYKHYLFTVYPRGGKLKPRGEGERNPDVYNSLLIVPNIDTRNKHYFLINKVESEK